MKLIIHRDANDTGGNCVELESGDSRILISERFISHSLLACYSTLEHANENITIYMSRAAKELIDINNIFITKSPNNTNISLIKHTRRFQIKNFKITPYLVDDLAFDALAFLIEAEGKRVFFSRDLRGQIRGSLLFEKILKDPPKDIDCLIIDDRTKENKDSIYKDEQSVQGRIEKILRQSNNITFLFTSSQDIGRIISAYNACLKTGSIFVIDIYTAFVFDKLRKATKNIPQFNWKNVKIKFIKGQADLLSDAGYKGLLYAYNKQKIDIFDINRHKKKILMLGTGDSVFLGVVKDIEGVSGAKLIYSMDEEYLTERLKDYCKQKKIVIESVHTCRHASIEDLEAFTKALNPKMLIPIYSQKKGGQVLTL